MEFKGKTALVTGGSRGIGRATSVALAQEGARIAINYVSKLDAAEETLAQVQAVGGEGMIVKADVSKQEEVVSMISQIEGKFGCVDLLITSAGTITMEHHTEMKLESWRKLMAVNVDGVYFSIMAVKDKMIERGYGRIVTLSSIAGLLPRPTIITYGTSKAAVVALTRNFAAALGPEVRVNCVAPGLVDTDMTANLPDETRESMINEAMLKRSGKPDDIADTILFLLSDRSSFITGQTLMVDGGRKTLP